MAGCLLYQCISGNYLIFLSIKDSSMVGILYDY